MDLPVARLNSLDWYRQAKTKMVREVWCHGRLFTISITRRLLLSLVQSLSPKHHLLWHMVYLLVCPLERTCMCFFPPVDPWKTNDRRFTPVNYVRTTGAIRKTWTANRNVKARNTRSKRTRSTRYPKTSGRNWLATVDSVILVVFFSDLVPCPICPIKIQCWKRSFSHVLYPALYLSVCLHAHVCAASHQLTTRK